MPSQTRTVNPASKLRMRPPVALLMLLIATTGAAGATSNAATPVIHHITTLHVSHLTVDHDTATGRVSGFPPRQKVTINRASYDADAGGNVYLAKGRLNGISRIELNFTDKNGYVSTGTSALKHAGTGLTLTRSERHGTAPQATRPQTIKLTVLPVMFSPPPSRPKKHPKG
jgi:hypothetical protein